MRRFRILIADNDPAIRRFVRANLEARNYETLMAMDGEEAVKVIEKELPDLVIMDILLPSIDGLEVLRLLRQWSQIPVIMLSARIDEQYKIKCLDLGGDDYLSKPFGLEELMARVKNILRRLESAGSSQSRSSFSCGELEIKFGERRVTVADHEIKLTPTEYSLLQELALNAEKVLTHSILLNKVWGPEYGQEREYLRVFVGRLRKKLEPNPHKPNYIVTVPWVGYKLSSVSGEVPSQGKELSSSFS
jgi:two-component system, OmpR family, KDP operon response regulator KdpE